MSGGGPEEFPSPTPELTDVQYVDGYRLQLTFADGVKVIRDFENEILGRGGIGAALYDPAFFRRAGIDEGALTWPNGCDYCPDLLYSLATGIPIPWAEPGPDRPFCKVIRLA